MKRRVKRIFEQTQASPDIIALFNSPPSYDQTFFYVTGYEHGLFEQAVALLYPDGGMEVLVSQLEATAAGRRAQVYVTKDERLTLLTSLLSGEIIGLNGPACSLQTYLTLTDLFPDASFVDISEAVKKARMVKDAQEIDRIRQACAIAADVAADLPDIIEEYSTESAVKAAVEYRLAMAGTTPAFDTIVAAGQHAALPHYTTGTAALTWPVLVDFGARYHRYCSDITRTLIADDAQHRAAHTAVREVQQEAIDLIAPGVAAAEVHERVATFLTARGFPPPIHATGHSLGLEVHDGLSMGARSEFMFEPGMVITVEPGVYVPRHFGVRIEDDILVTTRGCTVLTKHKS
jgi:Xaa-Pro dipeptidase